MHTISYALFPRNFSLIRTYPAVRLVAWNGLCRGSSDARPGNQSAVSNLHRSISLEISLANQNIPTSACCNHPPVERSYEQVSGQGVILQPTCDNNNNNNILISSQGIFDAANMCFGGGGENEAVIIRKRQTPRHYERSSREYVSRPEVSRYRRETVSRRSASNQRPARASHDNHRQYEEPRRSASRTRVVTQERRSRTYYD